MPNEKINELLKKADDLMKKGKVKIKPRDCMCKDGALKCKNKVYQGSGRVIMILPNVPFFMCEEHWKSGGQKFVDTVNEMRSEMVKLAIKMKKEKRSK